MSNFKFVRGKDGNVIGSTTVNRQTEIITVRDRQGNTLGYGDPKRDLVRGKDGNVLRWGSSDPGLLLK